MRPDTPTELSENASRISFDIVRYRKNYQAFMRVKNEIRNELDSYSARGNYPTTNLD